MVDNFEETLLEHFAQSNFTQMLPLCEQWAAEEPFNAEPYIFRFHALQGLGDREESRQALERCLEIDPSHAKALGNYGVLLCQDGNFSEGGRYFRRALDTTSMSPNLRVEFLKRLGDSFLQDRNFTKASEAADELYALDEAAALLLSGEIVRRSASSSHSIWDYLVSIRFPTKYGIREFWRSVFPKTAFCPYCGGELRTPEAKQCPHCFRSWRKSK